MLKVGVDGIHGRFNSLEHQNDRFLQMLNGNSQPDQDGIQLSSGSPDLSQHRVQREMQELEHKL